MTGEARVTKYPNNHCKDMVIEPEVEAYISLLHTRRHCRLFHFKDDRQDIKKEETHESLEQLVFRTESGDKRLETKPFNNV